MIKPYRVTTGLYLNDKSVFRHVETKLLTESEAQAIIDNPTTIFAADAYEPDSKNWYDLGNGYYSFKHGVFLTLKIKKKYSLIVDYHGTIFDSRKNPIVSMAMRKKIEPCKNYSLNDVFEYKDISRAIEYLKQFDCPINFPIDK